MVKVAEQMVSELHHVVIDTAVDNRIVTEVMSKQVAADKARRWNAENLVDCFKIAYVKRDGTIIVK